MELDGDGHLDLLSGSYSRHEPDMAGLFQVCVGEKGGTFRAPTPLMGDDGKPLIVATSDAEDAVVEKICTRPFAADLDGDGKLDLVTGNFGGTFAWFRGQGGGRFAATSHWLQAGDEPLRVAHHSDPFLVDWDGDGDLDLLSGSADGGVFLFANGGSRTVPKFAAAVTLVPPCEDADDDRLGDDWLRGPQRSTRIWVADANGDGKLDLLVGDQVTIHRPAEGVSAADAQRRLAAWTQQRQQLLQAPPPDGDEAAQKKFQAAHEALEKAREAFLRDEATGFVWLFVRQ